MRYSIVCRCCGTPYPGLDFATIKEVLETDNCDGDMNGGMDNITTTLCPHCSADSFLSLGDDKHHLKKRGVVSTYYRDERRGENG